MGNGRMTKYGKVRKKKTPDEVPLDRDGNVLRYGDPKTTAAYRTGKDTFIAALYLGSFSSYGSSRRLRLFDSSSGVSYPIFESDFLRMCQNVTMRNGEVVGEWGFCKKSSYYGVYLIQELDM